MRPWIWILIAVFVLVLILVFTAKAKAKGKTTGKKAKDPFPLMKGSEGEEVKNWQKYLNTTIIPPFTLLAVDGKFGPKTEDQTSKIIGKNFVTADDYIMYTGLSYKQIPI